MQRFPLKGLGIRPPTLNLGAIIPWADGQTGASEQGFGKGGDSRLEAGRVQGNVAKGDRGNAGGVRSGWGCWEGMVVGMTVGKF